jgi:hypothetical protein
LRSLVQSGGVPLASAQAQPAERFRVEDAVHERAGGVGEDVCALGGGRQWCGVSRAERGIRSETVLERT